MGCKCNWVRGIIVYDDMKCWEKYLAILMLLTCVCVLPASLWAAPGTAASQNLDKLIKTGSCRNCDLAGLNLTRMDLQGVDLEGADLSQAKLYLVDLSGANLRNARLMGAVFGGADLGDADLRGADLRGASLEGAYLQGARLDGTFITATPYEDAGVPDLEKEVYIADPAQPKRTPEKNEVTTAVPEHLSGTLQSSPAPEADTDQGALETDKREVAEEVVFLEYLPQPPAQKSVRGFEPVVIVDTPSRQTAVNESQTAPKPSPVMSKVELPPPADQ